MFSVFKDEYMYMKQKTSLACAVLLTLLFILSFSCSWMHPCLK